MSHKRNCVIQLQELRLIDVILEFVLLLQLFFDGGLVQEGIDSLFPVLDPAY